MSITAELDRPPAARRLRRSPVSLLTRPVAGPHPELGFPEPHLPRPDLVARLVSAPNARLAVIVAPAGYGKSTLLAEWDRHDERPFARVSLSALHAPAPDAALMAAALEIVHAFADLGWVAPATWASVPAGGDRERSVLSALIGRLHDDGRRFVLALDDADALAPAALGPLVGCLLRRLGPGSQVAIASRARPAVMLGRRRAQGELIEIGATELALSRDAAGEMLQAAGLGGGCAAAAERALALAEGWPAGVRLAAGALARQAPAEFGETRFDPADAAISDYVTEEFLDALAPSDRRFAVRSSILDELSGGICAAVLHEPDAESILARLAGANLLLVELDRRRERYRWNGLFRAVLQAELHRTEPELEARLHARASRWLAQRGDRRGALRHAIEGSDDARAGTLLWPSAVTDVFGPGLALVQESLAALGEERIARRAPLALTMAIARLACGDCDQAHYWALRAQAADLAAPGLGTALRVIEAAGAGSPARITTAATDAYRREPACSPWRAVCCLLVGVGLRLAGESARATAALSEGAALTSVTMPIIGALCRSELALLAIQHRDWDRAAELADEAAQMVTDGESAQPAPLSALVFAIAAVTAMHDGRVDEAKVRLHQGVARLAELRIDSAWYGAQTRILLARASIGFADTARARMLLAEASRLARRMPEAECLRQGVDDVWAEVDTRAELALSGPSALTIAELRVLRFLPSHRSFREIGIRLGVSVNTVKSQAHAVYRKLDAASRSEAVERASAAGLLGE